MTDVLLEALSTLYHNPDATAKTQASQWLEEWRLRDEAWSSADSILHGQTTNAEVLFFCAQTLVFKVQQDIEGLSELETIRLRDSLVKLLIKFSEGGETDLIRKQLALALAALCAHVPASYWTPSTNAVTWLSSKLYRENDHVGISCLVELFIVIPEESKNRRIGLHPNRREQYLLELKESFHFVLETLQRCQRFIGTKQVLEILSSWLCICDSQTLMANSAGVGPFVQSAVQSLDVLTDVEAAVEFISEVLNLTCCSSTVEGLNNLKMFIADGIVKTLPNFKSEETGDERTIGMARVLCDLAGYHEDLLLTESDFSVTLLEAILAVTSCPDEDVNQHSFEVWERLSYRVSDLMKSNSLSPDHSAYLCNVFERLMTVALLNLAKLPEDYPSMIADEKRDITRKDIRDAMQCTVDVVGQDHCLKSLIAELQKESLLENENWRSIEALLFAIQAVSGSCKHQKENLSVPLIQALGGVPDVPILQAAMCDCLASYASWLPVFADLTGTDPIAMLMPVIFKTMTDLEWAPAAVDAFCGLCRSCRRFVPNHASELLELHRSVLQAANAHYKWGSSAFVMKEQDANEVMGAVCSAITKSDNKEMAAEFIFTITDNLLSDLVQATEEFKVRIMTSRLKTVCRKCELPHVTGQLLDKIAPGLLQIAMNATNCEALIEEICTCLRYAIKGSGEAGQNSTISLVSALPPLFASNHHCGYLYVASELTKIFGRHPDLSTCVSQLVVEMFKIVCSVLKAPSDFKENPDLADDAFLMATRALNYCPTALLTDQTLLNTLLQIATQGVLVQHVDACRSILAFLEALASYEQNPDFIFGALSTVGEPLVRLLTAGVVGALPLRVLDDISETLLAITRVSKQQGYIWMTQALNLLPDHVATAEEKSQFLSSIFAPEVQESRKKFLRTVDDFADICRRSRIVREAALSALAPDSY